MKLGDIELMDNSSESGSDLDEKEAVSYINGDQPASSKIPVRLSLQVSGGHVCKDAVALLDSGSAVSLVHSSDPLIEGVVRHPLQEPIFLRGAFGSKQRVNSYVHVNLTLFVHKECENSASFETEPVKVGKVKLLVVASTESCGVIIGLKCFQEIGITIGRNIRYKNCIVQSCNTVDTQVSHVIL